MPRNDDINDEARPRPSRRPGRRPDRRRILTVAAGAAVVLMAVALAVIGIGHDEPETAATTGAHRSAGVQRSTTTSTAPTTTTTLPPTTTTAPPPPPPPTEPPTTEAVVAPPEPAPAASLSDVSDAGALCVGDSVMLGASSAYFGTITMCGEVDAVVGRQASAGAGVLQSHGAFPDTVVIHLGTNGYTNAGELDEMLGVVSGVPRVVLVNIQLNGTRAWESSVNDEIAAAAGRWPNVHLADWYGASAGHPDYCRDGIHLTGAGAEAYAAAIAAAF